MNFVCCYCMFEEEGRTGHDCLVEGDGVLFISLTWFLLSMFSITSSWSSSLISWALSKRTWISVSWYVCASGWTTNHGPAAAKKGRRWKVTCGADTDTLFWVGKLICVHYIVVLSPVITSIIIQFHVSILTLIMRFGIYEYGLEFKTRCSSWHHVVT